MNGKKVMLLGIAVILLGIGASSMKSHFAEWINLFLSNYAHWIGFVIVVIGFFMPSDGSEN